MRNRLAAFTIVVFVAAGCGCPNEHDAQGRSNLDNPATAVPKKDESAKPPNGDDKVDTKVEPKKEKREPSAADWPTKHPLGPTLGLPLEIHVDSPDVPEAIKGPTPMPEKEGVSTEGKETAAKE